MLEDITEDVMTKVGSKHYEVYTPCKGMPDSQGRRHVSLRWNVSYAKKRKGAY